MDKDYFSLDQEVEFKKIKEAYSQEIMKNRDLMIDTDKIKKNNDDLAEALCGVMEERNELNKALDMVIEERDELIENIKKLEENNHG